MPKRSSVRITDRDRGFKKLKRILQRKQKAVEVGIRGEDTARSGNGGDIDNVGLGAVHEFGADIVRNDGVLIRIPQRSWLRDTIDLNLRKYKSFLKRVGGKIYTLKQSPDQLLELFGLKVKSDIIGRINRGIAPANAASTVAHKGSSKPLVDTGQLKGAITHKVVR